MTKHDQERLSQIRAQQAYWEAVKRDAVTWDTAFLLKLLDAALKTKERS